MLQNNLLGVGKQVTRRHGHDPQLIHPRLQQRHAVIHQHFDLLLELRRPPHHLHVALLLHTRVSLHVLDKRPRLHLLQELHHLHLHVVEEQLKGVGRVTRGGGDVQLGVYRVEGERRRELLVDAAGGGGRFLPARLRRGAEQGLAVEQVQAVDLDRLLRLGLLDAGTGAPLGWGAGRGWRGDGNLAGAAELASEFLWWAGFFTWFKESIDLIT